jgi:hypothetical protein
VRKTLAEQAAEALQAGVDKENTTLRAEKKTDVSKPFANLEIS